MHSECENKQHADHEPDHELLAVDMDMDSCGELPVIFLLRALLTLGELFNFGDDIRNPNPDRVDRAATGVVLERTWHIVRIKLSNDQRLPSVA